MYLSTTTDEIIEQFLQEAASTMAADRRQAGRYPFFRRVTITPYDAAETKFSAFVRDISSSGIGLLHNRPLETQRMTLTIPTIGGRSVDLQTDISHGRYPCFRKHSRQYFVVSPLTVRLVKTPWLAELKRLIW